MRRQALYFADEARICARSAKLPMSLRESAEARSVALRPSEGVAPLPGASMISDLLTFPRTSRVEVETPVTGRRKARSCRRISRASPRLRDMGKQND